MKKIRCKVMQDPDEIVWNFTSKAGCIYIRRLFNGFEYFYIATFDERSAGHISTDIHQNPVDAMDELKELLDNYGIPVDGLDEIKVPEW